LLELHPISLKDANAFVARVHRHSAPVVGHKFSICAQVDGVVVAVAIVGRPLTRPLDNGATLEVLRLATDGTRNACSFLYGAAARAAFCLGYSKVITYILERETGGSLRASGWTMESDKAGGGSWTMAGRPRSGTPLLEACGLPDPRKHDKGPKRRWARISAKAIKSASIATAS